MEMRITISGLGLALGKTGFGANLVSGAYLETRPVSGAPSCIFGLTRGPSLGSSSGSVVFGHVQTEWFRVNVDVASAFRTNAVVGKVADVEISGAIVSGGQVDVKVDLIDSDGNVEGLFAKANIRSSGVQVASTKVRGVLKRLPGAHCVAAS